MILLFCGTIQNGVNFQSKNQIKKHKKQMSEDEINLINQSLSSINIKKLCYSYHSLNKLHTSYAMKIIKDVLLSDDIISKIIEYNVNKDKSGKVYDIRVLIRDKKSYRVKLFDCNTGTEKIESANLCFVYSLVDNKIVTAYWNKESDTHKTIQWKRYTDNIDILQYKSLMRTGG